MHRRTAILVGLALVALTSAAAAVAVSRTPEGAAARRNGPIVRTLRPPAEPTPTPTPTPEPDTGSQHGSSESQGVHSGPDAEPEHHDIHGSGSIAVVSGTVDNGSGGSETNASVVGNPRQPTPPTPAP